MDSLDPALRQLLDAQPPGLFSLTEHGKLKCEVNGHTLPARLDAATAFIQ